MTACDACDSSLELHRCPICNVCLCARCWVVHYAARVTRQADSLCHQMAEYAHTHALMRRGFEYSERYRDTIVEHHPTPDAAIAPEHEDWRAAHQAYAYHLRKPAC